MDKNKYSIDDFKDRWTCPVFGNINLPEQMSPGREYVVEQLAKMYLLREASDEIIYCKKVIYSDADELAKMAARERMRCAMKQIKFIKSKL